MNLEDAATAAAAESTATFSWRKWVSWDVGVLLLPIVAALPLLIVQCGWLWEQLPWRFFPLPILAVATYALIGWRSSSVVPPARKQTAVAIYAIGTLLLLVAIWNIGPWTAYFACIVCFLAWAVGRWGNRSWHHAVGWSCVALTTLPLPFGFDDWFHRRLISKSAQYASALLDATGIPHLLSSGQIQLRDNGFDLLACANNAVSIFALWSIVVFWCVIRMRSLLHCLLMLVAAVVWYLVVNSLQIFYIFYAWDSQRWDLSQNPEFAWLAAAATLITLACLAMTDQLFRVLLKPSPLSDPEFMPVFATLNTLFCWPRDPLVELGVDLEAGESEFELDEEEEEEAEFAHSNRDSREPVPAAQPAATRNSEQGAQTQPEDAPSDNHALSNSRLAHRLLLGLCALVAVAGIAPWAAVINGRLKLSRNSEANAVAPLQFAIDESTLPEQWKDWNRASFVQVALHESRWMYQWRGQAVIISLAPCEQWDGTPISLNTGWRTNSVRLMRAPRPASNWPWAFCEMKNELGGLAYVFHSGMDAAAEPIEDFQETQRASDQNILSLLRDGRKVPKLNYQFQVSCESGDPLTPADLQELQDAFLYFRKQLMDQPPAK